jgi:hypothetical protein
MRTIYREETGAASGDRLPAGEEYSLSDTEGEQK